MGYHGSEHNKKVQQGLATSKRVQQNQIEAVQSLMPYAHAVMLRTRMKETDSGEELTVHIYRKRDDNTWVDEGRDYIPNFKVRGITVNSASDPGPYVNFCIPEAEDISLRFVYGMERPWHVTKINTAVDSGTEDFPVPDTSNDIEIILAGDPPEE